MTCRFLLLATCAIASPPSLLGDDGPAFRTDENRDESLPWFQLVDNEFPPENSAHAISGELIHVDHLERRFHLRVDRNDNQDRGVWDLAIDAGMLPYGSILYHGALADLRDIPLGTHLHGLFYVHGPDEKPSPPPGPNGRVTPEITFTRCLHLEDDFSHHARRDEVWRIDAVDHGAMTLSATLQYEGEAVGKPRMFDLRTSTVVLTGDGFADLASLRAGQEVQFTLTWATLYGPGRLLEVFVDDTSRERASTQQRERHRDHVRERGLPGRVDAVDDESRIVTITFFGGVDPALFDELRGTDPEPHGWPFSAKEGDPNAPKGGIAVARESLMTYDPVNDRKGGNILSIERFPAEPGSGGVRIAVKCGMLLEGFRPGRIVRFYPAAWPVQALPREEQFFGRE